MKNNKGITLIALVITIIVMLILVAVTITMAVNGGLFTHAGKAASATNANIQAEQELANLSADMTTDQLIAKYATGQGGNGGGGSTPAATTWTHTGDGTTMGDVYTHSVTNEQFYVIGTTSTTVKLLSMYNLNAAGTAQDTTGANNTCAFSSTDYWSGVSGIAYPYTSGENAGKYPDLNDETTYPLGTATSDVKTRLQAYSTSLGATARLMTVEEVEGLGGVIPCEENSWNGGTSNCPTFINSQNFWLGSAYNGRSVWVGYGESGLGGDGCGYDVSCGVRPVIEISKSLIS